MYVFLNFEVVNSSSTSLANLNTLFTQELSNLYDNEELNALFFRLLADEFNISKIDFRVRQNELMSSASVEKFNSFINRLIKGEPLQYILGETEFYNAIIKVNSSVLIPRQETEELVRWIIQSHGAVSDLFIADLCTGSGCIAIALFKELKTAQIIGVDVSTEALEVARLNNLRNETSVNFKEIDLLNDDLNDLNELDIIVSNPPYVCNAEKELMHKNVLEFEPHLALFVEDNDPLVFYKRIAEMALEKLKEGGWLYFEINEALGKELKTMLASFNFEDIEFKKDLNGKFRMLRCRK